MTEQKKRARWTRPKVSPNSNLRDALKKCREAAVGIRAYADGLKAEADKVDQRVAGGETELTPEDREKLGRSTGG